MIGLDPRAFIKEDGDREFSGHEPALRPKITNGIWAMRHEQLQKNCAKQNLSKFVDLKTMQFPRSQTEDLEI